MIPKNILPTEVPNMAQHVALMNVMFGNAKGVPVSIEMERIKNQMSNIPGEYKELQDAFDAYFACLALQKDPTYDQVALVVETEEAINGVRDALCDIMVFTLGAYHMMGIDANVDMFDVVSAVMTRACATPEILDATLKKYAALGMEVYTEGEFPRMVVKSAKQQTDVNGEVYSKGKFLKSVSFKETEFRPRSTFMPVVLPTGRKFFGQQKRSTD